MTHSTNMTDSELVAEIAKVETYLTTQLSDENKAIAKHVVKKYKQMLAARKVNK